MKKTKVIAHEWGHHYTITEMVNVTMVALPPSPGRTGNKEVRVGSRLSEKEIAILNDKVDTLVVRRAKARV